MKSRLPSFRLAAGAALLSGLFPSVQADTLVFDGSNPGLLQTLRGGTADSFFTAALSGNSVSVTGEPLEATS